MRVRLLGTGSSDGWPHPWCACASCGAARKSGVDGRLLIELTEELRRVGAVVESTAVHAVHHGHDNPPQAELDALLAGWGASAPRDDDVLEVG